MKRQAFLINFFLLLSLSISPVALSAQSWNNYVINYTKDNYSAGSQNWQILEYKDWMYVANEMGLLEFHANKWQLYTLHNHSDVRAICKSNDNKQIFVGGYNEFGYMQPNRTGELKYTCLSQKYENKTSLGNIWNIIEVAGIHYFIAENMIVKYERGNFSTIICPQDIESSALINGSVYIATKQEIYVINNGELELLTPMHFFQNKNIKRILAYQQGLLIATSSDELYLFSDNKLTALPTDAYLQLKQDEIFSVATNSKYIAIGTVLGGLYLLDHQGHLLKHIDETNGLQNNTLLSLFFDKNGNLWMGLDSGLDYLVLNSPLTTLFSSHNFYGAGYDACLHKKNLYLATNRGLYYLNYAQTLTKPMIKPQLVDGSQGQVWSLAQIDGKLFCATDRGLYIVDQGQIRQTLIAQGTWTCRQSKKDPQKIYVSTYHGLYVLDSKTLAMHAVAGYSGSAITFVEDRNGYLWLKTSKNEVTRIKLNNTFANIITLNNYTQKENSLPNDPLLNEVDGHLLFSDQQSSKVFDASSNQFVIDHSITNLIGQEVKMPSRILDLGKQLLILGKNQLIAYNKDTKTLKVDNHSLPLIRNFEQIIPINDSINIIPNERGFSLWQSNYQANDSLLSKVEVNELSILGEKDSILYQNNFAGQKPKLQIAYSNNNIRISFAFGFQTNNTTPLYRYRINGGKWSDYSPTAFAEFINLAHGKYKFEVEGILDGGHTKSDQFEFEILPPWYNTFWGYLIFITLCLLIIFFIRYYDELRLKTKKKIMEEDRDRTLMEREENFKKESLEIELRHKSEQLANTAINLVHKNEVLIDLQEDISKILSDLEKSNKVNILKQQIINLNSKIDQNINEEDGFIKFREHFDLVHNDFIKRLSDMYPDLSMQERKLCAFVRINLSSKEIAPMLNISARGVETLRYRVRKKLNLCREDSLTRFLEHF